MRTTAQRVSGALAAPRLWLPRICRLGSTTAAACHRFAVPAGARDSDVSEAVAGFREVLSLAEGKPELSELGFKALKNVVKLSYRTGDLGAMLTDYRLLLDRVNDGSVTRNKAEKAINGILDLVSAADASAVPSSGGATAGAASAAAAATPTGSSSKTLADFYTVTLEALQRSSGNSVSRVGVAVRWWARCAQRSRSPRLASLLSTTTT